MSARIRKAPAAARWERQAKDQTRIDAVLASIQDGLVLIDGDGKVQQINSVAERQLAMAAANVAGLPLSALGLSAIDVSAQNSLRAGAVDVPVTRDGEITILSCTLQPFTDASGRPGFAIALRDLTVQREFDRMCSEFVLRASHELRTPIASVRMGLGLLGEKLDFPSGSRDRELYDTVQHELTRMVELLSDLLDLSRLRMGELLDFTDVAIDELIADTQQRFAAAAHAGGVQWIVEVAEDLPALPVSRSAIDRVFNTLVRNALSRTPAGGTVALAAERIGGDIVLTIADTGEVIAQARQNIAFEPFSQPSAKHAGAGLGLAICREIVRRHGGEIEIQSRRGKGTRFTITLPLADGAG